ncbi:MAG: hypothetical protein AAF970_14255, partial [Bacteroidota bacterium]
MGKALLMLITGALVATSVTLLQAEDTSVQSTQRQAERQYEQIAREIARSGYNVTLSKARKYEADNPGATASEIVAAVGTKNAPLQSSTQGGYYVAHLEPFGLTSFRVVSEGFYQAPDQMYDYLMEDNHLAQAGSPGVPMTPPPGVTPPPGSGGSLEYQVDFEFIESMAGWCSAIYMQRFEPNTGQPSNNTSGHGQTTDDYVA